MVEGHQIVMPVMQAHLESNEPLGDMLERLKLEYIEEQQTAISQDNPRISQQDRDSDNS